MTNDSIWLKIWATGYYRFQFADRIPYVYVNRKPPGRDTKTKPAEDSHAAAKFGTLSKLTVNRSTTEKQACLVETFKRRTAASGLVGSDHRLERARG